MSDIADMASFKSIVAAHDAAFEKFKSYVNGEPHTDDEFRRAALALRESFAALYEFNLIEMLQTKHPDIPLETIVRMVGEDRDQVRQ